MELKIRQNKQEIILKTLFLNKPSDVVNVPVGYTWQSKPIRASLWRLLLYAFVSGDWNPIHINPITALLYRSNLGGLTYCADLVLSRTKEGVHRIFGFVEKAEIIASKYEEVEFKRPVRVGMKFYYRFVLADRRIIRGKALCSWRFDVLEFGSDQLLYTGIWKSAYCPVEYSPVGKAISMAAELFRESPLSYAPGAIIVTLAFLPVVTTIVFGHPQGWFDYIPSNEYCWPIAP
jgi:hypothetical protein